MFHVVVYNSRVSFYNTCVNLPFGILSFWHSITHKENKSKALISTVTGMRNSFHIAATPRTTKSQINVNGCEYRVTPTIAFVLGRPSMVRFNIVRMFYKYAILKMFGCKVV